MKLRFAQEALAEYIAAGQYYNGQGETPLVYAFGRYA